MRRILLTALAAVAALPVLFAAGLWLRQDRLIFLPDDRVLAAPTGWEHVTIPAADGLSLGALLLEGAQHRPVVLHFHGNGGNAGHRAGLGYTLNNAGYAVVLAEYRGYGGNPGRPSDAGFAADAPAILDWVRARFPGRPLVLWGESLGTATVTRLAAGRSDIAGLVLESPFTSVADLAASFYPWLPTGPLLRHRFESLAHVPAIAAPMLLVTSEGDRLTPPAHARRLAAATPRAELLVLPGAAHPAVLNAPDGRAMEAVLAFIGRIG